MKFECSEDKFDRKKHFIPLTQLIENVNDESFVMTISASYGDGKTFFVNQWKEYLEKEGYKTLYYNAWENDTADNPLISFIANFQTLQSLIPEEKNELAKAAADVITDCLLSQAQNISNLVTLYKPILGLAISEGASIAKKAKTYFKNFFNKVRSKSFIYEQLQNELNHKKHIVEGVGRNGDFLCRSSYDQR